MASSSGQAFLLLVRDFDDSVKWLLAKKKLRMRCVLCFSQRLNAECIQEHRQWNTRIRNFWQRGSHSHISRCRGININGVRFISDSEQTLLAAMNQVERNQYLRLMIIPEDDCIEQFLAIYNFVAVSRGTAERLKVPRHYTSNLILDH